MEWYNNLDNSIKGVLIAGVFTIIVALINGLFGLVGKSSKKNTEAGHKVEQISTGSNNVVIGIQNNYKREN